jgi:hypothetical protein
MLQGVEVASRMDQEHHRGYGLPRFPVRRLQRRRHFLLQIRYRAQRDRHLEEGLDHFLDAAFAQAWLPAK